MEHSFLAPYLISQLMALLFLGVAWRFPWWARVVAAAGFAAAGAFNIKTAAGSPEVYVQAFGPHAVEPYRSLIYGFFAEHTTWIVVAIACGQIVIAALAMMPLPWRKLSYSGAIVFLLAISRGIGVSLNAGPRGRICASAVQRAHGGAAVRCGRALMIKPIAARRSSASTPPRARAR